ncbi:MAG: glycosyltransferase N-terminal domain-containing protein [Gemmatimonadaceae bacterium]
MNPLLGWAYGAAGTLASLATRVAPDGEGKLVRSLAARRGLIERYRAWGRDGRDLSRPLLWMHAPSVGEGLQARPVLERMRARHPGVQLAYTFFSPSAAAFASRLDVDFADYLPFDTGAGARAALDALRPSALVYAKLDVWPVLTREARRRGVALGMVSATVAPGSSRTGGLARALLHDAYAALDRVGAVAADDGARLQALGVRASALEVTGDTRYDQVAQRARSVDRASPLLAPLLAPGGATPPHATAGASARATLVAGSTWPSDEAVLLPAWERVRASVPGARLIIAPHEPTEGHLAPIEAWGRSREVGVVRLGAAGQETAEVILVDRVGVLGELYALADAAFVGGGFHDAGLHSVLEPAAFGAPVAFGPRFGNARDAALLAERGGGSPVSNVDAAARVLARWLGTPAAGRDAGAQARSLVESGVGAADRSLALVERLLSPTG